MARVFSVLAIAVAGNSLDQTELFVQKHQGGMIAGLMKGLLGGTTDYKHCAGDAGGLMNNTKHFIHDLKERDLKRAADDLSGVVKALPAAAASCKVAAHDLAELGEIFKDSKSPADVYKKIRHNLLANDDQIFGLMEDMGKSCTFKSPDGNKCGFDMGRIVRYILIAEDVELFMEKHQGGLMAGLVRGLLGETKDYKHCATDAGAVVNSSKHLITDLKSRHFDKAAKDMSALVSAVGPAMAKCKIAAGDLLKLAAIFKDAKSPADVYKKIRQNLLAHDDDILGFMEDMGKSCTFKSPDGNKCGYDLGSIVRKTLVADDTIEMQLFVEKHQGSIFSGLMKGLLGEEHGKDYKVCAVDAGAVINGTKHLMAVVRHFKLDDAAAAVSEILDATPVALRSCKVAAKDLKEFTAIMKGIDGPGDLYKHIRANILAHDDVMMDALANMAKVCTFKAPDGNACGYDLGKIIRALIVSETVLV